MKNVKHIILSITVIFICILIGMFLGRCTSNKNYITLSPRQDTIAEESYDVSSSKININTASKDELLQLPGVGDVLAQRIVDYRDENGSFQSTSDLGNIEGIGDKTLNNILPYITIGG